MKFLVHILMAVAIHAGGQMLPFEGQPDVRWVPLLVLLPYGLSWTAKRGGMRGRFRMAYLLTRLGHFSGVWAYAICVFGLGWIEAVRQWTGQELAFDAWPQPALLWTFAPFVLYQCAAIHAESLAVHGSRGAMWRSTRFQARMFVAALAPFLIYFLISIALAGSEVLRVHIESVRLIEGVYMVFLLGLFSALTPMLLSHTWDTHSLPPGQARDLFQDVARRADFRSKDVLLWKTGHTMANAAIVGVSARHRVVLLSDSLLAMLGPRELACVYGHEIGHCKRHHVPIYLGWALFFILGGYQLAGIAWVASDWISMLIVGASLALWYVCFGWMSRRFELEADLYSMQLTGDPEALIQALERVAGGARHRSGWRHFSTERRVRFLHRAAFDEVFRLRFLRRIRLLGRAGVVLGALVVVLYSISMVQRFGEDRLRAQLALGAYSEAWVEADWSQRFDGRVDEELVDLLRGAGSLANENGERVPIERVESALQDALQAGLFDEALLWARLLERRDGRGMGLLIEQMRQSGFPPEPDDLLVDWPNPWRKFALEGLENSSW